MYNNTEDGATAELYIDGALTTVQARYATPISMINIALINWSTADNTIYVDNIRVTEEEHAAATAKCLESCTWENGVCTVCGAQPELKFSKAAAVLENNLAIQFKADAILFATGAYSNPYATFQFNGATYTVNDYVVDGDYYVFKFSGIAPHQMGDDITYKLVATSNGEEVSSTSGTYSVLDYWTDALGKTTNGTLKTLLVDTLNYGAAAQTYKNYNTGNLVNAGLTEDQKALATADRDLVKIENLQTGEDGLAAQWKFASLLLDDAITVKLTFTAASKEGLTVKINDAEQEIVDSGTEGTYYVYYPLTPKQLSDTITAQVFIGETVVSKTLSFSAETYAATKAAGGDALADLVMAMMKYGDAAKAYAG